MLSRDEFMPRRMIHTSLRPDSLGEMWSKKVLPNEWTLDVIVIRAQQAFVTGPRVEGTLTMYYHGVVKVHEAKLLKTF